MTDSISALIAEAREAANSKRDDLDLGGAALLVRLADALEGNSWESPSQPVPGGLPGLTDAEAEAFYEALREMRSVPSGEDREALIEVLTSMPEPRNLVSDGVHKVVADDVADAILAAGFSRPLPVQVEVTTEMVRRAIEVFHSLQCACGYSGDHSWAEVEKRATTVRLVLKAALGGGRNE